MQLKNQVLPAALLGMVLAASPASAAVTINFETTAAGNPTGNGAVGADYSAFGATFSNAFYYSCGGGCPVPEFGKFIASNDFRSPFSITFTGPAQSFSFANVSSSSGTASAFGTGGNLLETINFAAFPATFSFTTSGIGSVSFASSTQVGVDDFTFEIAQVGPVPEPATWAMMLLGFGLVGGRMRSAKRRQKMTVSYA